MRLLEFWAGIQFLRPYPESAKFLRVVLPLVELAIGRVAMITRYRCNLCCSALVVLILDLAYLGVRFLPVSRSNRGPLASHPSSIIRAARFGGIASDEVRRIFLDTSQYRNVGSASAGPAIRIKYQTWSQHPTSSDDAAALLDSARGNIDGKTAFSLFRRFEALLAHSHVCPNSFCEPPELSACSEPQLGLRDDR